MARPLIAKVNEFWSRSLVRRLDFRVVDPLAGRSFRGDLVVETLGSSQPEGALGFDDETSLGNGRTGIEEGAFSHGVQFGENQGMDGSFQKTLDHFRSIADSRIHQRSL